jgi:hypothetical protein
MKYERAAEVILDALERDLMLKAALAKTIEQAIRACNIANEDDYQNKLIDIRALLGAQIEREACQPKTKPRRN